MKGQVRYSVMYSSPDYSLHLHHSSITLEPCQPQWHLVFQITILVRNRGPHDDKGTGRDRGASVVKSEPFEDDSHECLHFNQGKLIAYA